MDTDGQGSVHPFSQATVEISADFVNTFPHPSTFLEFLQDIFIKLEIDTLSCPTPVIIKASWSRITKIESFLKALLSYLSKSIEKGYVPYEDNCHSFSLFALSLFKDIANGSINTDHDSFVNLSRELSIYITDGDQDTSKTDQIPSSENELKTGTTIMQTVQTGEDSVNAACSFNYVISSKKTRYKNENQDFIQNNIVDSISYHSSDNLEKPTNNEKKSDQKILLNIVEKGCSVLENCNISGKVRTNVQISEGKITKANILPRNACNEITKSSASLSSAGLASKIKETKIKKSAFNETGNKNFNFVENESNNEDKKHCFFSKHCYNIKNTQETTEWHDLKTMKMTSKDNESFKCDECSYCTNKKHNLECHKHRRHKEKSHKCELCGRTFGYGKDLKRHLKTHVSTCHVCDVCGGVYKSEILLEKHKKIHSTHYIKPHYSCKFCTKSFSSKYILAAHINDVHLGQASLYTCEVCARTFTKKTSYQLHAKIHKGIKEFTCEVCGKSFAYHKSYKEHKYIHEEKKSFLCTICNKAFRQLSGLNIHLAVHRDTKCYVCSVCGASFKQSTALRRHERIHSGVKPYKCLKCNKDYLDSSVLRRHMILVHKNKPQNWKKDTIWQIGKKKDFYISIENDVSDTSPLHPELSLESEKDQGLSLNSEVESVEYVKTDPKAKSATGLHSTEISQRYQNNSSAVMVSAVNEYPSYKKTNTSNEVVLSVPQHSSYGKTFIRLPGVKTLVAKEKRYFDDRLSENCSKEVQQFPSFKTPISKQTNAASFNLAGEKGLDPATSKMSVEHLPQHPVPFLFQSDFGLPLPSDVNVNRSNIVSSQASLSSNTSSLCHHPVSQSSPAPHAVVYVNDQNNYMPRSRLDSTQEMQDQSYDNLHHSQHGMHYPT